MTSPTVNRILLMISVVFIVLLSSTVPSCCKSLPFTNSSMNIESRSKRSTSSKVSDWVKISSSDCRYSKTATNRDRSNDTIDSYSESFESIPGVENQTKRGSSNNSVRKLLTSNVSKSLNGRQLVLCLGNSITNGTGSTSKDDKSYPALLQQYLNMYVKLVGLDHHEKHNSVHFYDVINLGYPGATISKNDNRTYWNSSYHIEARDYFDMYTSASEGASLSPILLIEFGTNDAKSYSWNRDAFKMDYISFIDSFVRPSVHPRIYLLIPPPCYQDMKYHIQQEIVNEVLPDMIRDISKVTKSFVIDIFTVLGGKSLSKRYTFYNESIPRKYNDGIHPNDLGYMEMSHHIASVLLGEEIAHKIRLRLRQSSSVFKELKFQERIALKSALT